MIKNKSNNIPPPPFEKSVLNILYSYNNLQPSLIKTTDFEIAKKAGLMFEPIVQSHNDAINQAFNEFKICSKKQITNLFLSSLSTQRLDWRTGLPVYAIMMSFPEHKFIPTNSELNNLCAVCSSSKEEKVDLTFLNQIRFLVGGIVRCDIYEFAFFLKQINLLPMILPNDEDIEIINKLITIIKEADKTDTPSKLIKKIKIKGFKTNEEQKKVFLDTLGYCGILETRLHQGFRNKFTNLNVAPRNNRNSDFHYPVDWWTAKDGINTEAMNYWFGDYVDLGLIYD